MQETSSIMFLVLIFCLMELFIKVHAWTPQQNGLAERKNRHLLKVAQSLLFTSIPKRFWGEAVLTTTYLINRMLSRILIFKTLEQTFIEHFPKSHLVSQIPLKVFRCSAFVHIHSQHQGKLDARATKCIFVEYSSNKKGYKCCCPTSKKLFHSMDVSFFENIPYFCYSGIHEENHNHESQN